MGECQKEMAPDRNREFNCNRLTNKGSKQPEFEESQWKRLWRA